MKLATQSVSTGIALIAAAFSFAALAQGTKTMDGALADAKGMTLYTFDKDTAGNGKSVCNGPCATSWPPLAATATDKVTGDYTIVTRDDGAKQWAYKGKPLYLWINTRSQAIRPGTASAAFGK